jgi:selenocysteine-specific translation elongation factor
VKRYQTDLGICGGAGAGLELALAVLVFAGDRMGIVVLASLDRMAETRVDMAIARVDTAIEEMNLETVVVIVVHMGIARCTQSFE